MAQDREPRLLRVEDMVRRLLRRKADTNLTNALEKMHAAEIAQIFMRLEDEEQTDAYSLIRSIPLKASLLNEFDPHIVRNLIEHIPNEKIVEILKENGSDDGRYILESLPVDKSEEVLDLLDSGSNEDSSYQDLMLYTPESAGAIMTDSYAALDESVTVEEAISRVRDTNEIEHIFYVYVINEDNVLRGVVSLRQLILSNPLKKLSEVMTSNVWSVDVNADQEHVAKIVSRYNILSIPVINESNELVGIVTVDDVLDVLREEATEDILKMAGTNHQEEITSLSAMKLAWVRFPWLVISWLGSLAAAFFISQYTHELSKVIALAAFIPVINGTSGNVSSQSVAIIVRGLATGKVDTKGWLSVVSRQVFVGLLLGMCFGMLLFLVASYQFPSISYLGIIVGITIFLSMTIASTLASLIPLFLNFLKLDPALMTGPVVTTTVDLLSIIIYMNIARFILQM